MAEITKSLEETAGKITGGLSQSLSRLSSLVKSAEEQSTLGGEMSDSEYLGAIYKLMVSSDIRKVLDDQTELSAKEESEFEDSRRHAEIVKALTLRRVPKKIVEKKKEEVEKVVQPRDEKGRFKNAEPEAPKAAKTTEAPKVAQPVQAPKVETATKTKEIESSLKKAEVVKRTPEKPPVAAQVTVSKPPIVATAAKVIVGAAATTAALTGKESLAANIAKYESTGSSGRSFGGNEYNAYNKGTVGNKMIPADKPIDFSTMTISEYMRRGSLGAGDPQKLFAVGRYQIIPKTMGVLVKSLKIDPNTTTLTPDVQDMLFARGLTTSVQGRSAVDDYLKGKPGVTRDAAILALSMEFASVGVPYDIPKLSMFKNTLPKLDLKRGQSFYSGVGGNKAHNSPDEVGIALDTDRMKQIKTNDVIPPTRGADINQRIINNVDMKRELTKQKPAPQNVTNVTNVTNTAADSSPNKRVDDRPAHERTR